MKPAILALLGLSVSAYDSNYDVSRTLSATKTVKYVFQISA